MEIDLLRTYVAIVDTGSFTRAARQTFRTQSAVSMQMKRLESQLGRSLFRKEGRGLELTDDGKQLVHHARRLLAVHEEALASFDSQQQPFRLRLGCPDDYARSLMPTLMKQIRERYPNVSLNLQSASSNRLRQLMDAGELDMALVTRTPDSDEGYLLLQDRGVWIKQKGRPLPVDEKLPLALYEPDCKFHSAALDGLDKQQRPYELLLTTANAAAILAMVEAGDAISAVATATMSDRVEAIGPEHNLPVLPRIEIALVVAGQPHPKITSTWIRELIDGFQAA